MNILQTKNNTLKVFIEGTYSTISCRSGMSSFNWTYLRNPKVRYYLKSQKNINCLSFKRWFTNYKTTLVVIKRKTEVEYSFITEVERYHLMKILDAHAMFN